MNQSDEIKNKLDLVEIIGEYISLRPAGSNFKALCPFHNEKTPSFMVSPEKQIWHCFGCGKGGDVFSFLMAIEGLDFLEALKLLAPRAGVILKTRDFSSDNKRNKLLQITELASGYYQKNLNSKSDSFPIKRYLKTRGLDQTALNDWKIGYSSDSYDDLLKFLKGKGFRDDEILAAGISFKTKQGRYLNRFRDRIMFPLNDASGRTVAFTARINPDSRKSDLGKYINSPQSDIYDKSQILFALDRAKLAIKKRDYVILVEGQMDAISAHQAGFLNTCAVSGTALTRAQLNLIKRYTKNIILAFDQDLAGQGATDRGIGEALTMGFSLKVASLPKGQDPDDLIRTDLKSFKEAIKTAQTLMDYYLDREFKELDLTKFQEKGQAVNRILTVITLVYNKVEQDFWLKNLSQRAQVDEVFLREELSKIGQKHRVLGQKQVKNSDQGSFIKVEELSWRQKLAENLWSLILKDNQYCGYVFANLGHDFLDLKYQLFYEQALVYYQDKKQLDYQGFLNYLEKRDFKNEVDILKRVALKSDWYDLSPADLKVELIKNIMEIKKDHFKTKIHLAKQALEEAEKNNEEEKINKIMLDLQNYHQELKKII